MSVERHSCDESAGEASDDEGRTRPRTRTKRPRCKLDDIGRLNLQDILLSFNGPVSQEQAWALCYQIAKALIESSTNDEYYEFTDLTQIILHKDGDVWLGHLQGSQASCCSEQKAVFSIGMMVFKALDFGLDEGEERRLSPDLEGLITIMTSIQESETNSKERLQETDDEGIERDSSDVDDASSQTTGHPYEDEDSSSCSLRNVLQICTRHMQSSNEMTEAHYRAVIRAFVAEALELSQFLEKVANEKQQASLRASAVNDDVRHGSTSLQYLDALDFNDWTDVRIWRAIQARFWVQVISELRRGVKLKKVEANLGKSNRTRGRGEEFELTPYEILMDDIRERRYRLRKAPSPTPHLRKDAHAVILEFIRSRPPLKKASERQLPPLQKECTLRELLMESIKKPPKPLRSSRVRQHMPADVEEGSRNAPSRPSREESIPGPISSPAPRPAPRRQASCCAPEPQPRRPISRSAASGSPERRSSSSSSSSSSGGIISEPRRERPTARERVMLLAVGGESRRIVLGEVPPSRPEAEQESAQDVAAQWLDGTGKNKDGPHQHHQLHHHLHHHQQQQQQQQQDQQTMQPVPQPRQRIGKPDGRPPVFWNRKSRRRRILVAEQAQDGANMKENESSPTAPKPPRRDLDSTNTASRRPRKLIPVDFDLKLDAEDEDDEEDDYNDEFNVTRFDEGDAEEDEEDENEAAHYWRLKEGYTFGKKAVCRGDHRDDDEAGSANPWKKTGGLRLTRNEYHRFCDTQLESYDLATQCPSRRASQRKHNARRPVALTSLTGGTTSLPHSRPQSRQHTGITGSTLSQGPSPNISLNPSPSLSPQPRARQPKRAHTIAESKQDGDDQGAEWQDDGGQKATIGDMFLDERLSLTLEEIVHIRSVLTKAELESLPVEGRVKEDVEKRRVCFLCLKTRFGLLGPWGQRCRLCERTVCVKCYSKMRIPTEHFAHVPVVLLSPGLLLSPSSEPDSGGKNSWLRGAGAVGSAPASPASRRKDSALRSTPASTPTVTPVSMPTPTSASTSSMPAYSKRDDIGDKRTYKGTGSPAALSTTKAFSTLSSHGPEQRLVAERLRGVAMVVCHDCRIMVIQIIKSSRTTRATIRNNVISRLTLNLSPAYV